jgi:hypothetical protein
LTVNKRIFDFEVMELIELQEKYEEIKEKVEQLGRFL